MPFRQCENWKIQRVANKSCIVKISIIVLQHVFHSFSVSGSISFSLTHTRTHV